MSRQVHIVAVAARTPVGLTAASTAAALRAGVSRLREHPFMVDPTGEPLRCAIDGLLDPHVLGADRLVVLARHVVRDVIARITHARPLVGPLPVWLALPEHRPGFGPDEAQRVGRALQSERYPGAPRVIFQEAGAGHAGAFPALEALVGRIRAGEVELGIVAGADSYFDADTLDWLGAERRLAHANARSGLSPGEGASALALASDAARARLGLSSLALVRDVACARETRDPASDEGLLGEALGEAIARAIDGSGPGKQMAEDVYCDVNGERERVDDWGFALLRTSARFRDGTAYATSVAECGDLGAACAPLNCAIAVEGWGRGRASGATALVWGASWGGMRGAALLERSRG